MATYSKKKLLAAHPSQIDAIAATIQNDFVRDGFDVNVDTLMSGGKDISITKGNLFKAVIGMRSALKVTLIPQTDGVHFDANVGIYGQQAIPTVISMLFFWPVLITQIWGLVEQSSLDAAPWHLQSKLLPEVLHRLLLHHRSLPLNRVFISSVPTAAPRPTAPPSSVRSGGEVWVTVAKKARA